MRNTLDILEKCFAKFWELFRQILTIKSFVKFRITNRNISWCFEKYYQNFWKLFWKISKNIRKISRIIAENFENYFITFWEIFRKILRSISETPGKNWEISGEININELVDKFWIKFLRDFDWIILIKFLQSFLWNI